MYFTMFTGADKFALPNRLVQIIHQSIPMQRYPSPSGNRGAFAHVVSPGGGAIVFLSRPRGLGNSVPRGGPRAFDTRVKATTSREKNVRGQLI